MKVQRVFLLRSELVKLNNIRKGLFSLIKHY